jgi:hypothetical protein
MAVAAAPCEERDGLLEDVGGRPCRCSLYYSRRRRSVLVKSLLSRYPI